MCKKNTTIQIIRLLAMVMIVVDHTIAILDMPFKSPMSQLANAGIYIFIFLSAYLFGGKKIYNWKQWYLKRLKRIIVPFWIFLFFDFLLEFLVWGIIDGKKILVHILGLQGIENLGINIGTINLWYITLILILYLITPLIHWLSKKYNNKKYFVFVLLAIIQVIASYSINAGLVGHPISWCIIALEVYIFGYYMGEKNILENINTKKILFISVMMLSVVIFVFGWRRYVGENILYERIIQPYAFIVVDSWICVMVSLVSKKNISRSVLKIINYLDRISYVIYIVHGLVITMGAKPMYEKYGIVAYLIVVIIGTIVSAVLLNKLSVIVLKRIQKGYMCTKMES